MNLLVAILSQSERERQTPYNTTYMWTLKYDASELIYKAETDSHREQAHGCQGEGRKGKEGLGVWD